MTTAVNQGHATLAELHNTAEHHAVAFENGHVAWRHFGDGATVVLLHGGHGSWLHWARNIRALSARHAVWVPDLPGFGDSDLPAAPTMASLVDATVTTLDALVGRGSPVALVGFSFGGLVAANLAARRGAVPKLGLIGPGGHGGARRDRGELRSWREAARSKNEADLAEAMRHNLLMHMLQADASADAVALQLHTDACLKTRFRSKPISRAGGLANALDLHRGELLMVWGEHDVTAVPEQAARSLGEGRSACRTHIVSGAGHWVQYERADHINGLLLGWLSENESWN